MTTSAAVLDRSAALTPATSPGTSSANGTEKNGTAARTANVLGGDKFDPAKWLEVPARTFEDLKIGDVFRAPSRTLTDAHTSEFQAISGDSHPRHYNADYAKAHGLKGMLVQPLQVLALSAPGASLTGSKQHSTVLVATGRSRWRHVFQRMEAIMRFTRGAAQAVGRRKQLRPRRPSLR